MLVNALKASRLAQLKGLNGLRRHKNDMDNQGNEKQNLMRKYLNRLINSQKSKMTSVMIKLHQNHQKSKKDEMRKLNALEKMLN